MRKVFTLLTAFLLITLLQFVPSEIRAQGVTSITRTVSDCKAGTVNAIGWAMQNFFNDGSTASWNFDSGATWLENSDGTACLTGVITQYGSGVAGLPKRSFTVKVSFSGKSSTGTPDVTNLANCPPYSTNGWSYYTLSSGTLTGIAGTTTDGAKLNLTQHMMPSQYGIGAANQCEEKNNLGLTGWFEWQIINQPSNGWLSIFPYPSNPVIGQADICIRLSNTPPPPPVCPPCPILTHNAYTDFNTTKPAGPTTLWFNLHTKLKGNLTNNGDCLLFTNGKITLQGISASFTSASIPNGKIVADNTVSAPVTSYDLTKNLWITRVPLGYSSSDIFISAAILPSSSGFTVTSGKQSVITGSFVSNKSYSSDWFYGIAAYQPPFTYADVAAPGAVSAIGGGRQAGTPLNQLKGLVPGGSGGGGSNFTGSYSSTENFPTCVNPCILSSVLNLSSSRVLTLTGVNEANRIKIEWINNSGYFNDYFKIEKLNVTTGNFEMLSEVASKQSGEMENYFAYDVAPTDGDNFYRVNVQYLDGTSNASAIQKVNFKGLSGNLSVFPNPADEVLNIDLTSYKGKAVSLFVYNHLGQTVIAQQIENVADGIIQVDVSNQQVGNYLVRVISKGKHDQTKSFILNK